ncbi:putative serine protease K12H4.7 [Lutzomyia longipalpis]|uniref:putative serine protease K12H4.7 n=1 Tax=Lutzomyia longipalpis TaxID=7200 RepID=UPI00248372D7|nr:putative serine protease K12H4.7 [Lutzomyia longipalpis]
MDLLVVLCLVNFLLPAHGLSSQIFRKLHEEPHLSRESCKSTRKISEEWIYQWLDHTNPQDDRKWRMRFFANEEFYVEGGPIFIFVGGEWSASAEFVMGGHVYDMAKEFHGYLFYTEHRFYGKSQPTSNLSLENLRYLTSEQALADLAHFIATKTEEIPGASNSSVFLIGGSYAGSLVTWFSHKYPFLVTGAWASSAPLLAKVDFKEYFEVVAESIQLVGGQECFAKTTEAFKAMEDLIAEGNFSNLTQALNLCQNITSDEMNVQNFFQTMSGFLAVVVQSLSWAGIEGFCSGMLGNDDPLVGYAQNLKILGGGCLTVDFEEDNKVLRDTAWPADESQMMRRWIYQTCNEFGWFQTSTSSKHPFNYFPVEFFINLCQYVFGEEFVGEKIEQNTCLINAKFDGLEPKIKNVYLTHGQLDPWRAAGAQKNINDDSLTVILPNHSHCSDFGSMNVNDSLDLYISKSRIKAYVKNLIGL